MGVLYLLFGILANAMASISIKVGTTPPYGLHFQGLLIDLSRGWPIILGVFFYLMALGFYILALARLPLSIVHPIMTAGSLGLVLAFSLTILKEAISINLIAGLGLIIIGVFLVARSYISTVN